MKSNTPPSELSLALDTIRPAIVRAVVFSMIISLMALAHYALQPWFSWLVRALKRLWTDQEFPNRN